MTLTAGVIALAMGAVGTVPAYAKAFTNSDVKGVYSCVGGFNSEWVPGSGGGPSAKLEFADVAQIAFDGKDHFKGPETDLIQCASQDCGQFTCDGTVTGTYSTNPDGSGTASVTVTYTDQVNCGTFTGTLNMNLGNFGNSINFIQRTGATTIAGTKTPVDSAAFTLYCTKALNHLR
jgi:hypothetical protein